MFVEQVQFWLAMLHIFLLKIKAAIFDFHSSKRLGRERNLYQQGEWWSKERKGEGWVIEITPALMIIVLLGNSVCIFSCPFLTIHSNSTSNMANCTNDCKLVTLTFPTKTPALQANLLPVKSMSSDGTMTSFFSIWNKHALSQSTTK